LSDNVISITSKDRAEETLFIRVYPVWDLAKSPISDVEDVADYDTLIDCVTSTIAPNTWSEVGGPGTITVSKGMFAIANTLEVHSEVAQLLEALRQFPELLRPAEEAPLNVVDLDDDEMKTNILDALDRKIQLELQDEPLSSFAEYVRDLSGVTVLFDSHALTDENVNTAETVNIER
jgi:hypothetical protein